MPPFVHVRDISSPKYIHLDFVLSQEMEHQPAKQEEYYDTSKEDPFVLLCPSLHHADSVAANAQGVSDAVESLLGALKHLALLAQIAQDSLPARNVVIQRLVCV
jgi:hypothetical protein